MLSCPFGLRGSVCRIGLPPEKIAALIATPLGPWFLAYKDFGPPRLVALDERRLTGWLISDLLASCDT